MLELFKRNYLSLLCFTIKISICALLITIFSFLGNVFNQKNTCCLANFKTLKENTLVVGTNATLKPFEYIDEQTNQITGFDIGFIKKIAEMLQLKIEIVDMPFDALIPSLGSKIDIAVAAITKNAEREKTTNFSIPYYETKQFVLTKTNREINKLDDLKNLRMATQIGTTAQEIAEETLKSFGQNLDKLKTYNDYLTMVNDLKHDNIDAIILDKDTAQIHQKLNCTELKTIDGSVFNWQPESYCVACPKNNMSLLNAINEKISSLKNSNDFAKLIQTHITGSVSNTNTEKITETVNKKQNSIYEQFNTSFIKNNRWKLYLNGYFVTLEITFFAAILGLLIGTGLALTLTFPFNRKLKFIKIICRLYVDLIRGTPLILQLFILWFIVLQSIKNSVFVAIVAFGLNSGAYVCEIIRGSINAIDKGQTEAGLAMGFSYLQTLFNVVLPQGFKNSIPMLCNEIISLIKETAIVGYIAIVDLTRAADLVRASTYQAFMPLIITALIYFATTKVASSLLKLLENQLGCKSKT